MRNPRTASNRPRPASPESRPDHRRELGADGEQIAAQYLRSQGYAILDRNWRCRDGELDIIARHAETIVFCEVKTRKSTQYGLPIEAVHHVKARRLRQLAVQWLATAKLGHVPVRFDVVSVFARSPQPHIEHLPGAF